VLRTAGGEKLKSWRRMTGQAQNIWVSDYDGFFVLIKRRTVSSNDWTVLYCAHMDSLGLRLKATPCTVTGWLEFEVEFSSPNQGWMRLGPKVSIFLHLPTSSYCVSPRIFLEGDAASTEAMKNPFMTMTLQGKTCT